MRGTRLWLPLLLVLAVLGVFFSLFSEYLGKPTPPELASVVRAVPADHVLEEAGELSPREAAQRMQEMIRKRAGDQKLALRHTAGTVEVHLLVDLKAQTLRRWSSGASGTLVETVWPDSVHTRLRWAIERGDFSAPGLPPPTSRNLYH